MTMFAPSVFRPKFSRYVRLHLRTAGPRVTEARDIAFLLVEHPDDVQREIETEYKKAMIAAPNGTSRLGSLASLIEWLKDNWEVVLRILLALLPLILDDEVAVPSAT